MITISIGDEIHRIPARWQGIPNECEVLKYGENLRYTTSGAPPLADVEHCLTRAALNELNRVLDMAGGGLAGLAYKPINLDQSVSIKFVRVNG